MKDPKFSAVEINKISSGTQLVVSSCPMWDTSSSSAQKHSVLKQCFGMCTHSISTIVINNTSHLNIIQYTL